MCFQRPFGEKGYLQYRYGKKGKVELTFPSKKQNTQKSFRYSYEASPDHIREASSTEVTFENHGFQYKIFVNIFDAAVEDQGVVVTQLSKKKEVARLLCGEESTNNLQNLDSVLPKK